MKKILIVVDVQNDFVDGVLGNKEAQAIIPNVKKKISEYQQRGDYIIFTRDTHDSNYLNTPEGKKLPVEHCIKGTNGWQIGIEIVPSSYKIIDKQTFGYEKWNIVFVDVLEDTNYTLDPCEADIEIIGLDTDICVITNALFIKTLCPEANITVDASCCAGSTPDNHEAALKVMKMCQIDVIGE